MNITAQHTRIGREKKVPVKRFSDFNQEWDEKLFSDVFVFKNTNSFSRDLLNYQQGSVKNIHYGDIHTKFKTNFNMIAEEVPFVNNDVGKAIEIVNLDHQKVVAGLHTFIARSKGNYFVPGFVGYLMQTQVLRLQIMMLAQGSKIYGISTRHLNIIFFKIPSRPEQQKIAVFLSAVDKKIEKLTRKKELLEQYKKGVMQKIFTQEIRFKQQDGSNYPGWEMLRAKELFKNHSNKEHSGDLPILAASQEFGMVYRDSIDIQIKSTQASVNSYKIVEPGDFVISLRSFQGGIEYSYLKGICSPAYIILKPKIPIVDIFFKFYFKKESFIEMLSKTVIGIRDGKQITYENFGGLKLKVPSIAEQKKIAYFISFIDVKIESTNKNIIQTQQFKKGLLQQMFV